ncbi:flavodoxin family protein [Alcaligenaceae bacterium]|nr:flavodoxin family protein [Alcaligenaceae bacterium]
MNSETRKTLLIVWHSRTGAAKQMADAAIAGARAAADELQAEHRLDIVIRHADEAQAEDLLGADAMLFCCPENLAGLSGAMKEFFDRNYYAVLDRLNGRHYGLLVSAGSDGGNAVRQAERICTGWRLKPAAPAYIANTAAQTAEAILAPKTIGPQDRQASENMGGLLAALLL